jgi:hypothetical protein
LASCLGKQLLNVAPQSVHTIVGCHNNSEKFLTVDEGGELGQRLLS